MTQPLALPNYSGLSTLDPELAPHEVEIELKSRGWSYLGSGCYCSAYGSPDGTRVIKVGSGAGQYATLVAAVRNPDNPHLPTVYGYRDFDCGDLIIECERLADLRDYFNDEEWDEDEGDYGPQVSRTWRAQWRRSAVTADLSGQPEGPMKDALAALIDAAAEAHPHCYWDTHNGNLMVRPSDGALVLNDIIA